MLTSRNSESFRGCNDLHLAGNGDIYFTDQGQTGLHDPTGRVYRLQTEWPARLPDRHRHQPERPGARSGRSRLFVAMTRDNAVWRMPFMKDGSVSKVGRFCSMFGPSGPDGMTMDKRRPAVRGARLARPCLRVCAERRIDRTGQVLRRAKLHQCRDRRETATGSTSRDR